MKLKKILSSVKTLPFILIALLYLISCQTGVEDSPEPGTVRLTLRANPHDTYLVYRSDTFSVFTPFETSFYLNIFQGSVFSGDKFAVLFKTPKSYRQQDSAYNFVEMNFDKSNARQLMNDIIYGNITYLDIEDEKLREFVRSLNKLDSNLVNINDLEADYKTFVIFESYVPPGKYDRVRFGVNASSDIIKSRLKIVATSGKEFFIPLEVPPEQSLLLYFDVDFEVFENRTTQIDFDIQLFKSMYRYRDLYRFERIISVLGVNYL